MPKNAQVKPIQYLKDILNFLSNSFHFECYKLKLVNMHLIF